MKQTAILLFFISAAAGIFGYWGCYTSAGRKAYDEMAGMIPFFSLWISGLCFIIGFVLTLVLYLRK
jgi:hypothetical protein